MEAASSSDIAAIIEGESSILFASELSSDARITDCSSDSLLVALDQLCVKLAQLGRREPCHRRIPGEPSVSQMTYNRLIDRAEILNLNALDERSGTSLLHEAAR